MGGLSRILLRSLGLHEGYAWRSLMHNSSPACFSTVKGGFLIPLPQRRGAALSAQLYNVAPERSVSLHSLHICTNSLLPQSCVFQPPWASPCADEAPNSFPKAAPPLSALTDGAWQSLDTFFLPLGCGADGDRCGTGLGTPLCMSS